ncbi:hypothetical protein IWX76_002619 [Pedobacter sp. CAN_A7]|uniref:hypothetical protein n=1 Tax=Pedobacter sp. CAN_A7 TaxID=2787722 RepID=UPI0018CB1415
MKHYILLFLAVALLSCAKEDLHGPLKLKNGQVVELFVNHQYGSTEDRILKLPNKEDAGAALYYFEDRQPGYTYRVKAKFVFTETPLEDSPSYWYEYLATVAKEKHTGNDPFEIEIIQAYIPGGPTIQMNKKGNDYFIRSDKIQLTYANDAVRSQLEEIWQNALEMRNNYLSNQFPKWKSVKATVNHDPQKFGSAYLVQKIQFTP